MALEIIDCTEFDVIRALQTHTQTRYVHVHRGYTCERTAPSKTTDRLSSVSLLMSVESVSGAADARATVTGPSAEVAARLNPLPDCSFVFQSIDSRIFILGDCFMAQSSPGWAILSVITQGRRVDATLLQIKFQSVFVPQDWSALRTLFPLPVVREILALGSDCLACAWCDRTNSCALSRKASMPMMPQMFNTSVLGILSWNLTRELSFANSGGGTGPICELIAGKASKSHTHTAMSSAPQLGTRQSLFSGIHHPLPTIVVEVCRMHCLPWRCDVTVYWDGVAQEAAQVTELVNGFQGAIIAGHDTGWRSLMWWIRLAHGFSLLQADAVNPNSLAALLNRSNKICRHTYARTSSDFIVCPIACTAAA